MDVHSLAAVFPWDWPSDARDEILAVLKNREAAEEDRLLGAELAGELVVMDDEMATALLQILDDLQEEEALRGTAAISLGPALEERDLWLDDGMDSPTVSDAVLARVRSTLRERCSDAATPKQVRRMALEASIRAPESWHPDAIRAAYRTGDRDWRLTAVFCMRYVKGFDDEIVQALSTPDSEILYEAVCAARDQAVGEAWPFIQDLVSAASRGAPLLPAAPDLELPVLRAAMHAVAEIRPMEAHDTLADLVDSQNDVIASAAMEVLDMVEHLWMEGDEEDDEWLGYEDEDDEDDFPSPPSRGPGESTWH
jgi:hypothetical protein